MSAGPSSDSSRDNLAKPAGRILRLKEGYNPNSSSIGTILFSMPAALLGLTVLFGAASGLITAAFLSRRDLPAGEEDPPKDTEGNE